MIGRNHSFLCIPSALYCPNSTKLDQAFKECQKRTCHLAVMFEALNSCLGDMRLAFLVTGIPYLMPTPTSGRARTTRFTVAASLKANIIEAGNEVKFNLNLGHEPGFRRSHLKQAISKEK